MHASSQLLRDALDFVAHGIVPIRDPDAIAARLGELYADEPRRQAMAAAALACAAAATWRAYEERIARIVAGLTG